MKLDPEEIEALANSLAPKVAEILERRFSERPEWAMSIPEAASWLKLETHVIRDAINSGRLPCIRIGRSVRIRRSDLFGLNANPKEKGRGGNRGQARKDSTDE